MVDHLRNRGTAVVIRYGNVLLVNDRGRHRYSLPGGGVKPHERTYQAAARELYEETSLRAINTTYLCSFAGSASMHKAFLIEAEGHVHLRRHGELDGYMWWDMESDIPVFGHVHAIMSCYKNKHANH